MMTGKKHALFALRFGRLFANNEREIPKRTRGLRFASSPLSLSAAVRRAPPRHSGVVSTMKAMILAAGVGSRLDPLTRNVPKPLVPILNRPVMEYLIELLKKHGFNEIMVNLYDLDEH